MTAAKTKEKTLSERMDDCCKSFLWSAGIGTVAGGTIGVFLLKSKKWPAILGLGTGIGVAASKCEKSLNSAVKEIPDKEFYRCQEEYMARQEVKESKFRAALNQIIEQYRKLSSIIIAKIEEHEGPKNDWFSLKAGKPKYSEKCLACMKEREEECEKAKRKSKKEPKVESVSYSNRVNFIHNEMQLNKMSNLNEDIVEETNTPEEHSAFNQKGISAESKEFQSEHSAEIIENYSDTKTIPTDQATNENNNMKTDDGNMKGNASNSETDMMWTLMRLLRGENYVRKLTEPKKTTNDGS